MEKFLKSELGLERCESTHKYSGGGGCISETKTFNTDKYGKIFVKFHQGSKARLMFDGEYESLKALNDSGAVSVPKPISVVNTPGGGSAIVMQFIEMTSLRKFQEKLGEDLARLHQWTPDPEQREGKFGFHVDTCCGYIPMVNSWSDDWVSFYTQQRLGEQIRLVEEKTGDKEATELWSRLQLKIPKFFEGVDVKPSLLHGDLWGGNVAETSDGPVIYDPAAFWGHHEYDLAIGKMFGGFTSAFHNAYHRIIPKAPGFELRQKLYVLFHQLNHWNHFGSGYRQSSLSIMKTLLSS